MIDLGDTYPITVEIRDATGTPITPATVVVALTDPAGVTTSPTVTTTTPGVYTAWVTPGAVGLHQWTATAAGGDLAAPQVTSDVLDVRPTTPTLVSLADTRAHLRFASTGRDEQLRAYIRAASAAVEGYALRRYPRRPVAETQTLRPGATRVRLRETPATAVTTVTLDGAPWTGHVLDEHGILWPGPPHAGTTWPGTTLTVDYIAGDGTLPATIRHATLEMVRHLWETQAGGRSMGGQGELDAAPDATSALPWRVKGLIDQTPGLGVDL